jgi:hypothetical protein
MNRSDYIIDFERVNQSRIKGKEYPLSEGDIVVCVTESFQDFTYGRQYKLMRDPLWISPSLLPIESDRGHQPLPSYHSPTGYYFLPLHIWRELKINKVLE